MDKQTRKAEVADLTAEQMKNINGGMLPPGFPGYLSLFEAQSGGAAQDAAAADQLLKADADKRFQGGMF